MFSTGRSLLTSKHCMFLFYLRFSYSNSFSLNWIILDSCQSSVFFGSTWIVMRIQVRVKLHKDPNPEGKKFNKNIFLQRLPIKSSQMANLEKIKKQKQNFVYFNKNSFVLSSQSLLLQPFLFLLIFTSWIQL